MALVLVALTLGALVGYGFSERKRAVRAGPASSSANLSLRAIARTLPNKGIVRLNGDEIALFEKIRSYS
jgi:hypothetical protein